MAIKTVRLAAWLLDQVRKSRRLAELHIDDDVALSYRILYRAVYGRPAPAFRGVTGRVDAAATSWEWAKGH